MESIAKNAGVGIWTLYTKRGMSDALRKWRGQTMTRQAQQRGRADG